MVTMLLAFLFFNRRYTFRQICAVLLVTLGVIISTSSGRSSSSSQETTDEGYSRFLIGVSFSKFFKILLRMLILTKTVVLSQFLSSAMGLYLERTFRVFSPSWRETLFFTVSASDDLTLSGLTYPVALVGLAFLHPVSSHNLVSLQSPAGFAAIVLERQDACIQRPPLQPSVTSCSPFTQHLHATHLRIGRESACIDLDCTVRQYRAQPTKVHQSSYLLCDVWTSDRHWHHRWCDFRLCRCTLVFTGVTAQAAEVGNQESGHQSPIPGITNGQPHHAEDSWNTSDRERHIRRIALVC